MQFRVIESTDGIPLHALEQKANTLDDSDSCFADESSCGVGGIEAKARKHVPHTSVFMSEAASQSCGTALFILGQALALFQRRPSQCAPFPCYCSPLQDRGPSPAILFLAAFLSRQPTTLCQRHEQHFFASSTPLLGRPP
jgi:hypothetical protein